MKVLFAVNNESISESIIKKYQQEYKEIISSKNVYYFDAITRELQKDKSYDRIVISEDVEPFANNNYGVIDKFIFERLDSISDEATSPNGQDIPIILICADRRNKSEDILVKLFGIGIYSALLGQDRTISKVCELINKPRSKKDAKIYYRIDTDDVGYKPESEGDVNEIEIQNILNHYKKLGRNEEEYVRSFDNIAEQYTDAQLRVICKFLPLNVKAVLEANSQKYQELITFGTVTPSISQGKGKQKYTPNEDYEEEKRKKDKKKGNSNGLELFEKNIGKSELTKPVVIPSVAGMGKQNVSNTPTSMNLSGTGNINNVANNMMQNGMQSSPRMSQPTQQQPVQQARQMMSQQTVPSMQSSQDLNQAEIDNILQSVETDIASKPETVEEAPKKRRGRPRKVDTTAEVSQGNVAGETTEAPKKKRGRPRKVQPEEQVMPQQEEAVDLFGLGNEPEEPASTGSLVLPGLEDDEQDNTQDLYSSSNMNSTSQQEESVDLFSLGNDNEDNFSQNSYSHNTNNGYNMNNSQGSYNNPMNNDMYNNPGTMNNMYAPNNNTDIEIPNPYGQNNDANLRNLLSMSNKLVAFVGTSKNGTSFLVNSMAEILSRRGIKTAILDLTQNKNAYYIYTQNDEELRKTAFSCIENLQSGVAKGIEVNKNLSVYTTLPDRNTDFNDYNSILTTLMQNYSLVIMDCDYETNYAYFNMAQEIYLVQSYDILTIQPLTAFLRNLKSRNILDPNKLRIVLNKVLRVRSISERVIIGGMSSYNDPSMSYMTELFDKDRVQYCVIPFDQEAYSKYLDGLVNCEISTKGYPKNFVASLDKLANMMYPLLNNDKPANKFNTYNQNTSNFSSDMNATLNKMKNRY